MRRAARANLAGRVAVVIGTVALVGAARAQSVHVQAVPSLQGVLTTGFAVVPDNPADHRFYALELAGQLRIVTRTQGGPLAPAALDFSALVPNFGDENGALGLALHPNFSSNGYVYIFHSQFNAGPVLVRYTAPLTGTGPIDPATRTVILQLPTFSAIHISGCIQFGPDGLLYITHGDNGASGNAQNTTTPRGKVLRIDVNRDDFPSDASRNYGIPPGNTFAAATGLETKEIWSIGVRNAWRFSFDRSTGEMYFGDVGDSTREEVTRVPASAWQTPGGLNFGWPCYEGNFVRSSDCVYDVFPYASPMRDFTRSEMQCVVGGYVYRGCGVPGLSGRYVYSNCFSFNQIRSLDPANPGAAPTLHSIAGTTVGQTNAFAEDHDGVLYLLTGTGVYRVTNLGSTTGDCDNNTFLDRCELASGTATDLNNDGVLDVCTQACPADVNGDTNVSVQDVFDFLSIWFQTIPAADFNDSGGVTVQDIFDFLSAWFAGCI